MAVEWQVSSEVGAIMALWPSEYQQKALLTVGEVAHILSVSRSHAYDLVQEGAIPHVRLGRVVRVSALALAQRMDQWIFNPVEE